MKKLLILGGSRYVIPVIKKAHEMGIYVITCDYLPNNIGHKYSDEYHNVSIIEKEKVLELAQKLQIDGISSFGTDPGVVVASYVAEKMGLPTPPYQSVNILQHKDLFRNFLKANHFNVPWSSSYDTAKDALEDGRNFNYPVIVKPTDSAGSKGVTRVNNYQNLSKAVNYAFERSLSGHIIIEQFLEKVGCSSDSDCFSINGHLAFASFNNQYFDDKAANPFTPASYNWPSGMPDDVQQELRSELQRLITLLHMGTSIYNVETRLAADGKAYLMEVSPRGGGNRLSEILERACGQDLIKAHVQSVMEMPVTSLHDPHYEGAWAEVILHSAKCGTFNGLRIKPEFEHYIKEKDLWVQNGDSVDDFRGANEAIGTLVLQFPNIKLANTMMNTVYNFISINVI